MCLLGASVPEARRQSSCAHYPRESLASRLLSVRSVRPTVSWRLAVQGTFGRSQAAPLDALYARPVITVRVARRVKRAATTAIALVVAERLRATREATSRATALQRAAMQASTSPGMRMMRRAPCALLGAVYRGRRSQSSCAHYPRESTASRLLRVRSVRPTVSWRLAVQGTFGRSQAAPLDALYARPVITVRVARRVKRAATTATALVVAKRLRATREATSRATALQRAAMQASTSPGMRMMRRAPYPAGSFCTGGTEPKERTPTHTSGGSVGTNAVDSAQGSDASSDCYAVSCTAGWYRVGLEATSVSDCTACETSDTQGGNMKTSDVLRSWLNRPGDCRHGMPSWLLPLRERVTRSVLTAHKVLTALAEPTRLRLHAVRQSLQTEKRQSRPWPAPKWQPIVTRPPVLKVMASTMRRQ